MLCYPGGLPPCDFDRVDASSSLNLIRQKCLALAVVDARHKQLSIPGHQITGADELVKCHLVHGEPVIAAVDQALDQPDLIAEVVGVDLFFSPFPPCVRIVVASNFPTRQKLEDLIHDESTLL
jgi:hypothetical protein